MQLLAIISLPRDVFPMAIRRSEINDGSVELIASKFVGRRGGPKISE